MEELGIRFIGSKAPLLTFIQRHVQEICGTEPTTFGDLFCGTAVVSRLFKKLGYEIIANDNLAFCATSARAVLLNNEEPAFQRLIESGEVKSNSFARLVPSSYDLVLDHLNNLTGIAGFVYGEYSPGGTAGSRYRRQYFTDSNARQIDAIRERIATWQEDRLLTEAEEALLIYDLMKAANRVANIAGTYGYFMKGWDPRAKKRLVLNRSTIIKSDKEHEVHQEDANQLVKKVKCQILYFDPPYTWRHYGAYYHMLETIARWDKPELKGKSGLRPWEDTRSKYCMRDEAAGALDELIQAADAKHIFLSYNDEGLISHRKITEILEKRGTPHAFETIYRRYKSNGGGSDQKKVTERLYYVPGR